MKNDKGRMANSIKNIMTSMSAYIITSILNFVLRTVFITQLGVDYLGINGLFLSVISAFSIAELGFGTAIIYSMYKPIADKDTEKIAGLMQFYKNAYRYIAIAVGVLGLILIPFLNTIVKDANGVGNIYLIYILFVISSITSYLFIYKRGLLTADQKNYIVTSFSAAITIITYILQIGALIIWKNYYLYLIFSITTTIIGNLIIDRYAAAKYSNIFNIKNPSLDKETKSEIIKNVKALVLHRFGGVIVNSTDNIIISSFVGLSMVGLYSNYLMITSLLVVLCGYVFSGITASFGNLNIVGTVDKKLSVYYKINFLAFWMYGFCAICLFILFKPFITLWIGQGFLLNDLTVIVIVINFYLSGMRKPNLLISDALGLYWFDRFKPLAEGLLNLCFSIILVQKYGITGVFLGTFCSTILTCFWIEPFNVFKNGFKKQWTQEFTNYYKYFLYYAIAVIIGLGITNYAASLFQNFILKLVICILIPNIIFCILTFNTKEFKYFRSIIIRHI